MMRNSRAWKLVALCMTLFGGGAGAAAEEFRWQGRVAPGQAIEIKGVNGGVSALASAGPDIEVRAEKSSRRSDPESVQIQVVQHDGGVTICAVYPSADPGRPNECRPGSGGRTNVRDNDVNVEFTVRVPAGVRFIGRTVNGAIETENLSGDVEAHTVNGAVRFETSGIASAKTVNGSIHGTLSGSRPTGPMVFETVNGGIVLALPSDLSAEVDAQTANGGIRSDYPISVQGTIGERRIRGTIGRGGLPLTVKTVNGGIKLLVR